MKFLLLFALWATLLFVPSWKVAKPWQTAVGGAAASVVSSPGREIEVVDLELFYPFDIGVYAALCLASTWAPLRRRALAIAVGIPVLYLLEVATLALAFGAMMAGPGAHGGPDAAETAQRFAAGLIRVTGLVTAGGLWFLWFGRERLSLVSRAWIGG